MINTTDHSVVSWSINHIKSTKKVDWGEGGGGAEESNSKDNRKAVGRNQERGKSDT